MLGLLRLILYDRAENLGDSVILYIYATASGFCENITLLGSLVMVLELDL